MSTRHEIIASLPPESEYTPEQLIVRRMYVAGRSTPQIARELGISPKQAWLRLNPVASREKQAAYREANRQKRRDWDNAYARRNRSTCQTCGQLCGVGSAKNIRPSSICRPCRAAAAEARRVRIIELYNAGVPVAEIATDIGTTKNALNVAIDRLRRAGRIGYRYKRAEDRAAA